jgi:hypothetical protein
MQEIAVNNHRVTQQFNYPMAILIAVNRIIRTASEFQPLSPPLKNGSGLGIFQKNMLGH